MKKAGVAILGLGAVGGTTYRVLEDHREFYIKTQSVDISVESVLEPEGAIAQELNVPREKVASNIAEVVLNPDVNIVVECLGNAETAREYALAALHVGKTVVASNRELVAKYSNELQRAAKQHNAGLYFGACCAGGVPVVRTLLDGLQANGISLVAGVANIAANEILARMTEGASFDEARAAAEGLGLGVLDGGEDASYRLAVFASLAFHVKVPIAKVYREGIFGVSHKDLLYGKELGYVMKDLSVGRAGEDGVEVRVQPAFVREGHPLASVRGDADAVLIRGDVAGDVILYGKGAERNSVASALVADVIYASYRNEHRYYFREQAVSEKNVKFSSDCRSAFYLRFTANDESSCAVSKICSALSRCNISVTEVLKREKEKGKTATVVLITRTTSGSAIKNAVTKLKNAGTAQADAILRVME